jgi:hypothetical protein
MPPRSLLCAAAATRTSMHGAHQSSARFRARGTRSHLYALLSHVASARCAVAQVRVLRAGAACASASVAVAFESHVARCAHRAERRIVRGAAQRRHRWLHGVGAQRTRRCTGSRLAAGRGRALRTSLRPCTYRCVERRVLAGSFRSPAVAHAASARGSGGVRTGTHLQSPPWAN